MATTLPTVDNVIGKVQPQRLPRVNVPAGAFQTPEAELNAMAKTVQDFALDRFGDLNQTEGQELSTEFNTRARQLEQGNGKDEKDPDYEAGYLNQLGKNAKDARADYETRLQKIRDEISERASNGHVQKLFNTSADARQEQYLNRVSTHYNAQTKVYRAKVRETTHNEAVESAIAFPDNGQHITDIFTNALRQFQDVDGYDFKTAKSLAEEKRSEAHASVVLDLVQSDPAKAATYLQDKITAGEIDSDAQRALREAVEGGVLRQRSQTATDTIFTDKKLDTPQARLAAARDIKDDKLRDETVKRVKVRNLETEAERKRDLRIQKEEMWQKIDNDQYKTVRDIPSALKAGLDGTYLTAIERFLTERESASQGYGRTSDPATVETILKAIGDPDTSKFRDMDLNALRGKLTRIDYGNYATLQTRAKAKLRDALQKPRNYSTGNSLVKEALSALGVKQTGARPKSAIAKTNALLESVREFTDEYIENNDAKYPTREMLMKHIARETLMVNFYDSNTTTDRMRFLAEDLNEPFELEDVNDAEVQAKIATATGLTQALVANIITSLEKVNKRVTLSNIEKTYQAAVQNARAKQAITSSGL